jgi:IPT/TIG domain/FG-GAP repeat
MDLGPRSPLQAKDRSARRARRGIGRERAGERRGRASARARHTVLALALLALMLTALAIVPLGNDAAHAGGSPAAATFVQQGGKLTGAGEEPGGRLGSSAALSGDGSTLIVGAPKDGHGAAYVYARNSSTGEWEEQGPKLTAGEVPGGEGGGEAVSEECAEEPPEPGEGAVNECAFGTSVAISADGNTALVGDPSATSAPGAAWVFTRSGSTWTRAAVLAGSGEAGNEGRFGRSVALSADGATAIVGVPSGLNGRGGAWVFTSEGSTWTRGRTALEDEEPEFPLAHFGRSVALSADGATALIGGPGYANYTGAAWTFTQSGGKWTRQSGTLTGEGVAVSTHFGKTVALSGDGSTALVGAPDAEGERGAAWVFTRTGTGRFAEQGGVLRAHEGEGSNVPETEGRFGASLALSGDGDKALVGAPHAQQGVGWVAMLTRSGETWSRLPEGLAGAGASAHSWMGAAVALSSDGTLAAVGASRDNTPLPSREGVLNGAAWVFEEKPSVPAPVVTSVAPARGTTEGGTEVTINGENFNGATQVEFGGVPVKPNTSTLATIKVLTPPHAPGHVKVTVTTLSGTSESTAKNGFTYEEPGSSGEKSKEVETTTPEGSGKTTPSGSSQTTGGTATGGVQAFTASGGSCRVSVAKKRLAVTRYRSVALRLVRTGTGSCSGSIAISYRVNGTGRRYTLRTIGTARFSIPTGTSKVVTVTLSKAGQKWLRSHKGKGNANLAIARVVPAPTVAQSASVRLNVKKARKAGNVKQ